MSESPGSHPEFTPEELQKLSLKIPAFKRRQTIEASRKLRRDLTDPGKRGGAYSPLDPINQKNLLEFGTPTRPIERSEIKLPSTNTALNAEETKQVIEIIQGKRQYLSLKEVNRSVDHPRLPAFQALFTTAKSRAKMFIRRYYNNLTNLLEPLRR